MTEEQLDVALSKICMAFDTNAYAEIQVANVFIYFNFLIIKKWVGRYPLQCTYFSVFTSSV